VEIDEKLGCLNRDTAALADAPRNVGEGETIMASVHHFCASARARFEGCADFAAKRQFLHNHIERIFFDHGTVAIVGYVPEAPARAARRRAAACGTETTCTFLETTFRRIQSVNGIR
jgi:hypothetical protein